MKKFAMVLIVLIMGEFAFLGGSTVEYVFLCPGVSYAENHWKSELDDICSKTQDAMIFTADELRDILARCDKLKLIIEKLEDTQRKVYLKRLQMCKNLFVFVLDAKEKK